MKTGRKDGAREPRMEDTLRAIAIPRGEDLATQHPRISAFIWGGKVRPTPTLPYGRWKGG